ncbi:hypothetical protein LOK49_LG08G01702 [Camellia lanceoleosa]|uniref:Uncharacterized protein n=1 Tax=Camellia lanceoleosa TaxID=1840588 RepID=A0ACC0GVD7_9ERIC|nr:hypothetical protein LOK49_LG08G01702 [Camellia lanceoleosa]
MLRPLIRHSSASSLLPRKHSAAQHSNKQSMGISLSSEYLVEVMGAPEIQKFCTFQMHVDNTLNLLRNGKVKGIRIHGMVGSGKTTIMLSLNNHKEVGNLFDIVIWVKVSTEGSKDNLCTE